MLTIVIIGFIKMVLFSLGIKTPEETEWEWRLVTITVFLIANNSLLIVVLSPIFLFKSRKSQVIYGLIINTSLSFVIGANRLYNLFFQGYISLDTVQHSAEGLSMIQALFSTISISEFFWIIDIPLLFYIFTRQPIGIIKYKSLNTPMISVLVAAMTISLWTPLFSIYSGETDSQHVKLKESGVLMYYVKEVAQASAVKTAEGELDFRDKQRIDQWFDTHGYSNDNDNMFGEMEGKNVIMLQVEALQNAAVNKKVNGQEITPNLNKIIEDSLFFDHCYDQVGMATADAEVLVNLSKYPLSNVSVYMRYPNNTFNSLANTLQEEGYDTAAFHGHYRDFYNRNEAYPNLGFEQFYSRRDYDDDEVFNGLLGDKTFLDQSADYIQTLEEPFHAFMVTLTSHHPFNYIKSDDYDEIDVSGYENNIVGDYIRSIHYADKAIGQFYSKLEEQGILDDTIVVIYGDHAAFNYNERDYEALNEFFGVNVNYPPDRASIHKVPFIIDTPQDWDETIEERVGMIDIFPTVINLLGIENEYLMGRDVLNTEEDIVILQEGSFIKDNIYYFSKTDTFYDINSGKELAVMEDDLIAQVEETLDISNLIYQVDFFNNKE